MADKLRIFPLTKTQLQYAASQPVFEPLAAQTLGNAASSTDGFDADLLAVANQLSSETNLINAGDSDLADAGFPVGKFAADNIDPIVHDVGAFTSAGDSIKQGLDDSAQIPDSTPPPAQGCQPADAGSNTQAQAQISFPGPNEVVIGSITKGDCTTQRSALLLDTNRNNLHVESIRVKEKDAAYQVITLDHYKPDALPAQDRLLFKVSGANTGRFDAELELTEQKTRRTATLHVVLTVVNAGTAAAANFLPALVS